MGEQKLNEFGPVGYEAWRTLVERDLAGAPFDKRLVKRVAGVDIQPLYTREASGRTGTAELPGVPPYTRGSSALGAVGLGWDVRQELACSEPAASAQAAREELHGGATGLTLKLDRAARSGSGEHGVDGIALANLSDLELVLSHVKLDEVPLTLCAGVSTLPVAAGLIALARKRNHEHSALHGGFGADPLGALAAHGALPTSLDGALRELGALALWAHEHAPSVRAVTAGTGAYHDAGADAATEIAIALATGLEYLRALTAAGLDVSSAAKQLVFGFSIGRDFFVEIAKLRAARKAWTKVVSACGGSVDAQAMFIHARTSFRTKTQRDPWVNLLRATAETFSAAVGGADIVTTGAFDEALGESDAFARRMARNTQHMLRHEASLHRVVDPAGGSWYVESVTEALAASAWKKMQAFEQAGGMTRVILSGSIQKELAALLDTERKAVETRRIAITGVNEFPHVGEARVTHAKRDTHLAEQRLRNECGAVSPLRISPSELVEGAVAALAQGATFAEVQAALESGPRVTCTPLKQERLAQPFESLRDQADRRLLATGKRPTVFLANLGPIPEHKARAMYAQNYFEAGGFAVLGNDGFKTPEAAVAAFAESGADLVAICSSDAVYAELAEATAHAFREKGPKAIVLAGNPGDRQASYEAAGVTDFIFMGNNAYATLRSLLERAGAV